MMDTAYYITPHARDRWEERCGLEGLQESLAVAVPFGAQYSGSAYLLDPARQMVFVVADGRTVTTILTREQAVANMQAFGLAGTKGKPGSRNRRSARATQRRHR